MNEGGREDLARADAGRYADGMSATVESPAPVPAPPPIRLVSVEEYHQGPERAANGRRTELIRGVVVEKKVKSPVHSFFIEETQERLEAVTGSGQFVRIQDPITMADSEPEPDVAVLPGKRADYRFEHPRTALVAVEVAVTTLARDRDKADLYAEANIPEHWIILPERGLIEVYTEPRQGLYTVRRILSAANGDTLTSVAVPALCLDLKEFFAS